jgi:hypothetical protein
MQQASSSLSQKSINMSKKRAAAYKPTEEEWLAAAVLAPAVLAPSVLDFEWKTKGEMRLHMKELRKDSSGWVERTRGRTIYPTTKQIFTEERWRIAKNVASLPNDVRPAVYHSQERKKVKARQNAARRVSGKYCLNCGKDPEEDLIDKR